MEGFVAENQQIAEKDVAKILHEIFENHPDFLMTCFQIMAGNGKNSASMHYETSNAPFKFDEPLLLDSGLQTKYGTTDITRTVLIDPRWVKEEFKDDYTVILRTRVNGRVVKGKPETMKFLTQFVPRYVVNQKEKDYKHGTEHGVGHSGCVHEETEVLEGSVFTVEPGVHIEGSYGIRIEDDVTCQLIEGSDGFLSLTPLRLSGINGI